MYIYIFFNSNIFSNYNNNSLYKQKIFDFCETERNVCVNHLIAAYMH